MAQDLYKIIYISAARHDLSDQALETLLVKCRDKNAFFDITGYMVYHERNIIQLLEGRRTAVEYIYNTIRMDDRHQNITELCASPIENRAFADWQMGFQKIDRQRIETINTMEDMFQGELSMPQLDAFCNRASLFFETFLKFARLENYALLKERMTVV